MTRPARWWLGIGLGAIVLWGWLLREYGRARPIALHPDEIMILKYMERVRQRGWLDYSYAGGFFTMAEATRQLVEWVYFRPREWLRYWRGEQSRVPEHLPVEEFARPFNVALGAGVIALTYGLCRTLTANPWAAAVGALLMAAAAYPIEHSHYIESDTAALAALTAALAALMGYQTRPTWFRLAPAGLAVGYAAGTKYPLVVVLPVSVVTVLATQPRADKLGGADARSRLGRLLMIVLFAAAGFAIATPAVWKWEGYWAHARSKMTELAWETALWVGRGARSTVGASGCSRAGPLAALWLDRVGVVGVGGVGWIGRADAKAAPRVACGGGIARRVPLLLRAPFVRSQEFMYFLPSLAAAAALAVQAGMERCRSPAVRLACAATVLLLALPTIRLGLLAADRCGWSDTRWMAADWMARSLPADALVAFETYTPPGREAMPVRKAHGSTAAANGVDYYRRIGCDYLIHNATYDARGVRDPFTGRLFPTFERNLLGVREATVPIRVWSVLEPDRPRITFRSPSIELWAFDDTPEEFSFTWPIPQPAYISARGRETFSPVGEILGAREVVEVDDRGRTIAVGGPLEPRQPVWVLLETEERDAEIFVVGWAAANGSNSRPMTRPRSSCAGHGVFRGGMPMSASTSGRNRASTSAICPAGAV